MGNGSGKARYCRCGILLARDNQSDLCAQCQRRAVELEAGAPPVPRDFWEISDKLRDALASWHMGRVIAAYRLHPYHGAPLSQELVARWMGITQTQLSRIESGPPISDLKKLIRWAVVLRIPEVHLWFKLPASRAREGSGSAGWKSPIQANTHGLETDDVKPFSVISAVGEVVIVAVDRRTFLAGSGAGILAGGRIIPLASYENVSPELVEHLASQIESYYLAEASLGPHAVIPAVLVQQELIDRLLAISRGEIRRSLLRTNVAYSGLVTWLYQDAGDLGTASNWANKTLELAHRVGDVQLVRHALTNKAMICTDQGDGPGTLDLALAALADETSLCAKVRVQAMQQSAHGHSLASDRRGADYALDKAEALLSKVDDDYPWYNACRRSPTYIPAQRATCYTRLGLGVEAVALWEQVLKEPPAGSRRDVGVYRARQAVAYANAGQPEAAAGSVHEAANITRETSSIRLRRELAAVWPHLASWHNSPIGRQIGEVLQTL